MNYYKRHLGDYARDAGHLSLLEHGVYTLLLDRYYTTEGPLPADIVYRICRAKTRWERAAVDSVVSEFFTVVEGKLVNCRAESEIALARKLIESAQLNGAHGGRPKKSVKTKTAKTGAVSSGLSSGNPEETQSEPKSKLTKYQVPLTNHHTPEPTPSTEPNGSVSLSLVDSLKSNTPGVTASTVPKAASAENVAAWKGYAQAYRARYQVDPVRNAKVNSQIKQLVLRLGAVEAPEVAAWYVRHNSAMYVRAKHPVDLLLRDCEGLRTEWARGQQVTDQDARAIDKKQSNFNAFAPLIAEAEAREAKEKNHG